VSLSTTELLVQSDLVAPRAQRARRKLGIGVVWAMVAGFVCFRLASGSTRTRIHRQREGEITAPGSAQKLNKREPRPARAQIKLSAGRGAGQFYRPRGSATFHEESPARRHPACCRCWALSPSTPMPDADHRARLLLHAAGRAADAHRLLVTFAIMHAVLRNSDSFGRRPSFSSPSVATS